MGEGQGEAGEEIGVLCCFPRFAEECCLAEKNSAAEGGLIFSIYGMPEGIP
jgi:hypothetical protein